VSAASLPSLVQRFFTQRLLEQQGLSSHTVASYRDTFRLLLAFATKHIGRAPSKLRIEDFDVSLIEKFLQHLEHDRGNSVRTRNTRLAAVHAFFRFVAVSEPALFLQCQRILAIPSKRCEHGPESEAAALVEAPDVRSWIGNRDRTLLLVAVQTGLRNSELTALRRQDVMLGTGAHVRCLGKGRKMRCTPLRPDVIAVLKGWLLYQPGEPGDPVFPSSRGGHLSADALQRLVSRNAEIARLS
jgi:integrase/recombinase XerD